MLGLKTAILLMITMNAFADDSKLTQAVGQNCGNTGWCTFLGLDVTPWPPGSGSYAIMTCSVVFNALYLQEIVLGTEINGMFWNYDPVDVGMSFPTGGYNFQLEVVFPTDSASYVSNVQFVAGEHICCWQFSYQY